MLDMFWKAIDAQLDRIEETQASTGEALVEILGKPEPGLSSADTFFAGSGGDRQLLDALLKAGWRVLWIEADYHYAAEHSATLAQIEYVEGDVYINYKQQ